MTTGRQRIRQCVATQDCENCKRSSNGGICPQCAIMSYFSMKERAYIFNNYDFQSFVNLFQDVNRTDWEKALGSLYVDLVMRRKDPVIGCPGKIQDSEHELERNKEELDALRREFSCQQADLTPQGFVKYYEERNIPLIQDLSTCTDDEHWYLQPYDDLWS